MADVADVEPAMTPVKFPLMRREVMVALAGLADRDYQQRVWLEQKYPHPMYFDDLTLTINVLFDDCQILPDPMTRIGTILVEEDDELSHLHLLGRCLSELISDLGEAPDSDYLADARWESVCRNAALALAAMVRVWAM